MDLKLIEILGTREVKWTVKGHSGSIHAWDGIWAHSFQSLNPVPCLLTHTWMWIQAQPFTPSTVSVTASPVAFFCLCSIPCRAYPLRERLLRANEESSLVSVQGNFHLLLQAWINSLSMESFLYEEEETSLWLQAFCLFLCLSLVGESRSKSAESRINIS